MNLIKLATRLLLGRRLPMTSGERRISGITQPIIIRRDQYGIPYIQAGSEKDAYFALGFCQGQDRAFQLEMLVRICRGTLSALIGEAGLQMDRLSCRLGFRRYALGHYDRMEAKYRGMIDAFARGIHAGSRYGSPKLPHEFTLLRAEPTTWTGVDVLATGNYIAFGLSAWSMKLTRWLILKNDGPDALKSLDRGYADWQMVTSPVQSLAGTAVARLAQDLDSLAGIMGLQSNSNNWVINNGRTATGRPILANDPHLGPMLPAPWYLVHLQAPGLKVAGASFVGAPNIPSGHNEDAAWGVTASLADNVDLFIEELGPDGKSVREGDKFVPCTVMPESIQIKGNDPFEDTVIITPRGPIISDVLEDISEVIAFQATWMTPQACEGLIRLHHADDYSSFREAVSQARIVSQNFVYADVNNIVGWQYTADVPQRGEAWGTIPLPGWDKRFHWQATTTPWPAMPHLFNPETGFLATANQKPVVDDTGPYLGQDFIEGYRHARIMEMLAARDDWNLNATRRLQIDQLALPWREMKPFVLQVPGSTPQIKAALALLRDWDGVTSAESAGAALYEYFVVEMLQRMAQAKAPKSSAWVLGQGFHPLVPYSLFIIREVSLLVQNLREQPEGWFSEGWPTEIQAALASAMARLEKRFGSSPHEWRWGEVHQLVLAHPLGVRPPLDKIFNLGPFPTGGDHQTVAQAGRSSSEFGSEVTGLANLRYVHDVGNWEDNRVVIAGGQSGNPFSPHYADLLSLWLQGKTVTIPWSDKAVAAATKQKLVLLPP